ncbi:MAG: hypothetical protein RIE08_02370 [Acidimicrobiales bacterium]
MVPGPERPLEIYVSYGTVKSASTFAFELTKRMFIQNGFEQPRLSDDAVEPGHNINFVTRWDEDRVDALRAEAQRHHTVPVLKTHARPSRPIVELLESGVAAAHAVYRDPRDMALSLMDAGRAARAKERRAFSEIVTLDDATEHVERHLANFDLWTGLTGVEPVDYATVTADTASFASVLGDQTGLTFDHEAATAHVTENEFIQFNQGHQRRHESEMSAADSERIVERFASFYERFPGLR